MRLQRCTRRNAFSRNCSVHRHLCFPAERTRKIPRMPPGGWDPIRKQHGSLIRWIGLPCCFYADSLSALHVGAKRLPSVRVIDEIKRTQLSRYVVVPDQMCFVKSQLPAEPGAELDQRVVGASVNFPVSSGWQTSMEMVSRLRSLVAADFSSSGTHCRISPSRPIRKCALTSVVGSLK